MEAGTPTFQKTGDGICICSRCQKFEQTVSRPKGSNANVLPRHLFIVPLLFETEKTIRLAPLLEIHDRDAQVIEGFVSEKRGEMRGGHGVRITRKEEELEGERGREGERGLEEDLEPVHIRRR